MARRLRIEVPGGLYHVIARGNERKAVYRDDHDRTRYLDRLAHYREKFGFQLLAYCSMDNHVHLAIETGKAPLSRIMAGLQSSYTQYFNRRHDRVGHLFQGRYKALLVEKDPYALALVRYIHENPVKARAVERPEQYGWSSDRSYRKGKGPKWLDCDRVLRMLGRRRSAAVREYRRLMREAVEEPYEEVPSWGGTVKGDEAFADRVLQAVGEPAVVPRGMTVERLAREVARVEGVELYRMQSPSRDRETSRARFMVAWLAREVGRISVARTAKFFSRAGGTMIIGLNRLEGTMKSDRHLRQTLATIRDILITCAAE
jgi:REP element-mobilizing transposase RayT